MPRSAVSTSKATARFRSISSGTTFSSAGRSSGRSRTANGSGRLRDVAYQARTPNFWNSMALARRQEHVPAGRGIERRKGTAGAGERGVARLPDRALPQCEHYQHGMRMQSITFKTPRPLSRRRASALQKDPEFRQGRSRARERRLRNQRRSRGRRSIALQRREKPTTSGHALRAMFGKRVASVNTNRLNDASLQARRERCRSARSALRRRIPSTFRSSASRSYLAVDGYYSSTGDLTTEARARAAALGVKAAEAAKYVAAGFIDMSAGSEAVATSNRLVRLLLRHRRRVDPDDPNAGRPVLGMGRR